MNIRLKVLLSLVILPIPLLFGFIACLALLTNVYEHIQNADFGYRQVKDILIFAGGPIGVIGLIRGLLGKNDFMNMYFLIHGSLSYIQIAQKFLRQAIITPSISESIIFVFIAAPLVFAIYWVINIGIDEIKKC